MFASLWTETLVVPKESGEFCMLVVFLVLLFGVSYTSVAKGFTVRWPLPPAGELPPRVQSLGSAQFTRICGLVPTFLLW
jgi:hypothetical protein